MKNNNFEKKDIFSKETKQALVSNKNIILYYHYLNNSFPELNKETRLGDKLFRDDIEKNIFLDKNEWSTLEEFVTIVEKAIKITDNFDLPKIVGALLPQYQKEYKLQEFKDAAKQNLKAFFFGPVELFRHISFFNHLFNQTKDIEFISGHNGECILKINFKNNINPVYDYVSEKHIEGMLSSILDLYKLENGNFFSVLKEYDLIQLIENRLHGLTGKCLEKNNKLYLNGSLIAEKINLLLDKKNNLYLGKYEKFELEAKNKVWAWRVVKNVYMNDKYLVLRENEIYNAPYFITRISWNKHNFFKIISNLSQVKISKISPLGKGYARLIEERQRAEKEKIKIRAERQKMEKEYQQLLLKEYIHPRFIKRAKIGPIPFANISATNIFIDINDSTSLRTIYGDDYFRTIRNVLLEIVKKCLHEVAGEWAWINKIMGDGCYIVLGAYNYFNDKQDDGHINQSAEFAINLQKQIGIMQKQKDVIFHNFSIRIGMECGTIELGEIYSEDVSVENDREVDFNSTRFFDTDGHSVNIAKRIESISKVIVKKEKRKNKGGIFIGPAILSHLQAQARQIDFRKINLEKYELFIKDYLEIEEIGEIKIT